MFIFITKKQMKKLLLFLLFIGFSNFIFSQTIQDKVGEEVFNLNFELKSSSIPKPYDAQYDVFEFKTGLIDVLLKEKPKAFKLKFPNFTIKYIKRDLHESGFVVNTTTKNNARQINCVNYEGTIEGSDNSVASLYVSEKAVSGIILDKDFNKVYTIADFISPSHDKALKLQDISNTPIKMSCDTKDIPFPDNSVQLQTSKLNLDNACVRVYLEIDYDIFVDKGGTTQSVLDYINGVMSQVKLLYTNEGVNITISEIFIWNTPSPYNCSNSGECLNQFWQNRPQFNGDIGHLISYQASGGIAYLDALCHPAQQARRAFSSIRGSYNTYPNYSWTVMVIAHEIGHNLGSRHTHACVWNGNNTAIDGCAGGTEGNCPTPSNPQEGGTIMSYCHLQPVGINFTKGFGPQPSNVIRNFIANADCVEPCDDNGGADTNLVKLEITFDNYPMEIGWEVLKNNSVAKAVGVGTYGKDLIGETLTENIFLEDGDYVLKITDSYSDGVCCTYGEGKIDVIIDGYVLSTKTDFGNQTEIQFTFPFIEPDDCENINFSNYNIISYGGSQDQGTFEVIGDNTLIIENNAWKAIEINYNVTDDTVIDFEFKSDLQGEIHGLGMDDNLSISSLRTFRVYGTQRWGIGLGEYNGGWQSYRLQIGQIFTDMGYDPFNKYLFFTADNDGGNRTSQSQFRNIKVHEGNCQ
jgi:hypothetical protein